MRTPTCTVLFLAGLGSAAAQAITSVAPDQGSVGASVVVDGSGFGLLKKPKVFLTTEGSSKKYKLKVVSDPADGQVTATFKKAPPGIYDLNVEPKGLLPILSADAFEVMLPEYASLLPAEAAPLETITLAGDFLGTKKGKLRIDGKKAKVVQWTEEQIVALMPKKLSNGIYDVSITNKIGTTVAPFAAIVAGSEIDATGPERLSTEVDGDDFEVDPEVFLALLALYDQGPPAILSVSASVQGSPQRNVQIDIPFDLEAGNPPVVVQGDPDGFLRYSETTGFFEQTIWSTEGQGDDYTVVVHDYDGVTLRGEFWGTLQRVSGDAGEVTVEIAGGDFRVAIEP